MAAPADTTSPGGAGAWRELLRAPGVPRVVGAGLLARLPLGMNALGEVLLIRDQGGSYAAAGLVAAGGSVATAVSGPALGRAIDRLGQTRVLLPLAVLYPAAVAGLVLAALADAALAWLVLLAVATGAFLPPVGASIRVLLPTLVPRPELRATAYAMEASLQEVFFITGPLLVALLVTVASPSVALAVSATAGSVGTVLFATSRASRSLAGAGARHGGGRRGGALASGGVRTVALASMAMGAAFGAVEVSMPAFGEANGSRAAGGLALAAYAAGSLAGGIWIGARPAATDLARRYALALTAFAAGLLLLLLASSIGSMVLLILVAGLPIAPAFAAAYGLIDDTAPSGTSTEAFAWMSTAIVLGLAAGTAAAGALIERAGTDASLALACAAGFAGLACAVLGRATLRKRTA